MISRHVAEVVAAQSGVCMNHSLTSVILILYYCLIKRYFYDAVVNITSLSVHCNSYSYLTIYTDHACSYNMGWLLHYAASDNNCSVRVIADMNYYYYDNNVYFFTISTNTYIAAKIMIIQTCIVAFEAEY